MNKLTKLLSFCQSNNLGITTSATPTENLPYTWEYEIGVFSDYWNTHVPDETVYSTLSMEDAAEQMMNRFYKREYGVEFKSETIVFPDNVRFDFSSYMQQTQFLDEATLENAKQACLQHTGAVEPTTLLSKLTRMFSK